MVSIKSDSFLSPLHRAEICQSDFTEKTTLDFEQIQIIHFTQFMYVEHKRSLQ